jgi:hypothetical protein
MLRTLRSRKTGYSPIAYSAPEPWIFKIKKPRLKPTKMRVEGIIAAVKISPTIGFINSSI